MSLVDNDQIDRRMVHLHDCEGSGCHQRGRADRTPQKPLAGADFGDSRCRVARGAAMAGQPGFFDLDERYRALVGGRRRAGAAGAGGRLRAVPARARGGAGSLGSGQGRPAALRRGADVQGAGAADALHAVGRPDRVSARDRLSFMRFVGLALHDPVPDAKTIWLFREQLTRAGAIERLFQRFDAALRGHGPSRDGRADPRRHGRPGPAGAADGRGEGGRSAAAGRLPAGRRRGGRRSTAMRAGR